MTVADWLHVVVGFGLLVAGLAYYLVWALLLPTLGASLPRFPARADSSRVGQANTRFRASLWLVSMGSHETYSTIFIPSKSRAAIMVCMRLCATLVAAERSSVLTTTS